MGELKSSVQSERVAQNGFNAVNNSWTASKVIDAYIECVHIEGECVGSTTAMIYFKVVYVRFKILPNILATDKGWKAH